MNNLTRAQFLAITAVVAFLVSIVGTVITSSYLAGIGSTNGALSPFAPLRTAARQANQEELTVASVEAASPAVVSIIESKDVPVLEQIQVSPFDGDPFFQQFFGDNFTIPQYRQKGTEKQNVSSGSGFIVSSDGYIVTNKHVVADTAGDYTVLMNDGSKLKAKVLARDPVEDLAIVKVDKAGLPTVKLGDSAGIKIGETAIAIGNSLGEFRNTVSVGVISGLQRSITAGSPGIGSEDLSELIQTDAAINPGNSGGPLLNLKGEVIGINTAIVQGAQNIGFSIPVNKAKHAIESVKKTGRIIYPYIGVRYIALNPEIQKENKLPVAAGAWLKGDTNGSAVIAGSPAAEAGLKNGDIITEVNGSPVDADHSLAALLEKYSVGDTIELIYLRDGRNQHAEVTLRERP